MSVTKEMQATLDQWYPQGEAKELPSFEMSFRAKSGVNISGKNKTVNYVPVAEENRQRKVGGGRKAKTVKNIYLDTIISGKNNKLVQRNLDDAITGALSLFLDKKGKTLVSKSVMVILLNEYEELDAKTIMNDFGYGKTQAYRVFDVWKFLMNLQLDLAK